MGEPMKHQQLQAKPHQRVTLLRVKRQRDDNDPNSNQKGKRVVPEVMRITAKRMKMEDQFQQMMSTSSGGNENANNDSTATQEDTKLTFQRLERGLESYKNNNDKSATHFQLIDCDHANDRLRFLDTTNINLKEQQKSKKNVSRVLDPLTRQFDDILKKVHTGESEPQEYINLCLEENLTNPQKWLNYACSNGQGTILHATASWNKVEDAKLLIQSYNMDVRVLNSDGQTAKTVAGLCCHEHIDCLLPMEETEEFIYDYYYISNETGEICDESDDEACAVTMLEGAIGYFNNAGQLVVEKDYQDSRYDNEDSNNYNLGDDYDSNDEGNSRNDYPDEENEEHYLYGHDDDDSWSNGEYRGRFNDDSAAAYDGYFR